jgi:leucyl aminopeptidase
MGEDIMHYAIGSQKTQQDCLVLGFFEDGTLADDKYDNTQIKSLLSKLPQANQFLLVYEPQGLDCEALFLINCGKKSEYTKSKLIKLLKLVAIQIKTSSVKQAFLCMPNIDDDPWQITQSVLIFSNVFYQFERYKSKSTAFNLEKITISNVEHTPDCIERAQAIASGIHYTRDLGNTPANDCTPTYLAEQALELDTQFPSISSKIIEREEMQELGMGALLAVSQGSSQAPKLIEMKYHGGGKQAPIVLVGKGITFDSGGLTLKTGSGMTEMKYDMCGAATVFGVLKAIAQMQLPINVIGLIAASENLPSSTAIKPGDVVRSMSGLSIEIVNTDAEGRLVLCDALSYAERYEPKMVLDIATLTGAMVIALGKITMGFFTKDSEIANDLIDASHQISDKAWQMPLDDEYISTLSSPIADIANAKFNSSAGSITAACFLSKFTQNYRWAHCDIAGVANISGDKHGATGRPVPLLTQFLINQANEN